MKKKGYFWGWIFAQVMWIVAIILVSMLSGCRSVKYVPVEVVKSDTTYINKVQRDSIYQLDSIYIRDKGDTVLITKTKYIYRDKLIRDTVFVSHTDSIQVPYPVEKQLSRWQQFKVDAGEWVLGMFIVMMLSFVGYMYINKRR